MPYPLEKLPYGLRRRLRELATRSEAYALQVAAPNYTGFQPVQKIQLVPVAEFSIAESKLQKHLYPDYWPQNYHKITVQPTSENSHEAPLYIVSRDLQIRDFNPNFKLSLILDDFRFEPKEELNFYDCHLDTAFIESLLHAVYSPIDHISFYASVITEDAAKMVFNAPGLKKITINEPSFPPAIWWIEALAEEKCTDLKEFTVYDAQVSIFEIDKGILHKFIKAQRDDFELVIIMEEQLRWHSVIEPLKKLFNEEFKISNIENDSLKKKVTIGFEENSHEDWYYILRVD
uniref:Methyltransf_21 domain-containing protein n=1 Tax=Panagrellus redivivus TaxID=6233 RepID=A0A7E4ZRA1_PANRE